MSKRKLFLPFRHGNKRTKGAGYTGKRNLSLPLGYRDVKEKKRGWSIKGSVRFCPSCATETDSQTAPKEPPTHASNRSKPPSKNRRHTTPSHPPSSTEKRSAVHWPTQCAPIANAARCIVHHTAPHQTLYSGTKSAKSFCPDTMKTSGQTAKHFNQNKRAI